MPLPPALAARLAKRGILQNADVNSSKAATPKTALEGIESLKPLDPNFNSKITTVQLKIFKCSVILKMNYWSRVRMGDCLIRIQLERVSHEVLFVSQTEKPRKGRF